MMRASKLFSDAELSRIKEAVAEAERKTSGEIVPVVATSSGDYDRAEDMVGLWVGGLGLALLWLLMLPDSSTGDWGASRQVALGWQGLLMALAVIVVGFLVGTILASRVGFLRRLFTPRRQMMRCVEQAAGSVFFEQDVRQTRDQTGILIYVSLFEHVVLVNGDKAISQKLSDSDWVEVRDRIVSGLKAGQPCDGMVAGILLCGELLGQHFPIAADDENELANDVRIID